MPLKYLKKIVFLLLITGGILLLDQVSKSWVIENLQFGQSLSIFPPFLYITRSMNTGIAFGIGEGGSEIILLLILPIVAVLLFMFIRSKHNAHLQQIALALVIGGALGNLIDRIQHGHVVDFFHIDIPSLVSNVSNFADHAIVFGVFLMLIDGYLQERAEKRENLDQKPDAQQEENLPEVFPSEI